VRAHRRAAGFANVYLSCRPDVRSVRPGGKLVQFCLRSSMRAITLGIIRTVAWHVHLRPGDESSSIFHMWSCTSRAVSRRDLSLFLLFPVMGERPLGARENLGSARSARAGPGQQDADFVGVFLASIAEQPALQMYTCPIGPACDRCDQGAVLYSSVCGLR